MKSGRLNVRCSPATPPLAKVAPRWETAARGTLRQPVHPGIFGCSTLPQLVDGESQQEAVNASNEEHGQGMCIQLKTDARRMRRTLAKEEKPPLLSRGGIMH